MKKLTFTFLLLLPLLVSGQWYSSYGVTRIDQLSQKQLDMSLQKAKNTIGTGIVLTFAGAITGIVGYVVEMKAIDEMDPLDPDMNKISGGSIAMYAGAITASIGIPIWISGAVRKGDIEIAMARYGSACVPTVGLKIRF